MRKILLFPKLITPITWIYIVTVLFLCLYDFSGYEMPEPPLLILGIPTDKIIHFVMFLPFSIILHYHIWFKRQTLKKNSTIIILISGILFAVSTEVLQQSTTSYRQFDGFDIVADICGVVWGLIAVKLVARRKCKICTPNQVESPKP